MDTSHLNGLIRKDEGGMARGEVGAGECFTGTGHPAVCPIDRHPATSLSVGRWERPDSARGAESGLRNGLSKQEPR